MLDIKITRGESFPKQTITNVSYTPEDKPLDSIVYYLICAADKLNSDNKMEQTLALPRMQSAYNQLGELIKQLEKE